MEVSSLKYVETGTKPEKGIAKQAIWNGKKLIIYFI